VTEQWIELFKDVDGAYSSGSVRDFHPIPFSMRFPNGSSITNTVAKLYGNHRISKRMK
jgi:hypothetical protein